MTSGEEEREAEPMAFSFEALIHLLGQMVVKRFLLRPLHIL